MPTKSKFISYALLTTSILFLVSCAKTQLAIRAISDPSHDFQQTNSIHIDAMTYTEIKYRAPLVTASSIAKEAGLNIVPKEEADYYMMLKFKRGLKYDPEQDQFFQYKRMKHIAVGVKVEEIKNFYGVINAVVIPNRESSVQRTVWEGSVEVSDLNNPESVKYSLNQLFLQTGSDHKGWFPKRTEK